MAAQQRLPKVQQLFKGKPPPVPIQVSPTVTLSASDDDDLLGLVQHALKHDLLKPDSTAYRILHQQLVGITTKDLRSIRYDPYIVAW